MSFYGDNSRWFIGEVKSISDPIRMGRVKVRIFGVHADDEQLMPDDKLPWAQVLAPVTEGGTPNQGNFLGIQPTARVFGVFLDGTNSQMPLVLGSIPHSEKWVSKGGIQSHVTTDINAQSLTNEEQDGYVQDDAEAFDETIVKHEVFDHETKKQETEGIDEPLQTNVRKNVYPNNKVKRTTSGHVIEIDDTPGAERLHVVHKTGTSIEIQPSGDVVTHHKNGLRTVVGDDRLKVTGNVEWVVNGNLDISVLQNINLMSEGNLQVITTGRQDYHSHGNMSHFSKGQHTLASETAILSGTTKADIRGARVDLATNDPVTVALESFKLRGVESPAFATAGGMANMPVDDNGNSLGPTDPDAGPMSPGSTDLGPPGDCTRKNIGASSAIGESNNDPGAISSREQQNTDGFSYGTYQISTKVGRMQEFIDALNNPNGLGGRDPKYLEYGRRLNEAGGNSAAANRSTLFERTWKEMAYDNPSDGSSFAQAQHDFIQATHYDVAVKELKAATGIDPCARNRSNGLQDAIWSTSVQHGPHAVTGIVKNALARTGKTAETVTDAELISAIYDERMSDNGFTYFHGSTPGIRKNIVKRFKREKLLVLQEADKTLENLATETASSTASVKGFGYSG